MSLKTSKVKLLLVLFVLIAIAVYFLIFNMPKNQDMKMQNVNLPSCGTNNELFSHSPVDLELVERVTPQGEFGPSGGHVFPVKHVYFLDNYTPSMGGLEPNRPKIDVYAPADMWITRIQKYWDEKRGDEYYIYFSPCKEIYGSFFHLSNLSSKLLQEFENNKGKEESTQDRGIVIFKETNSFVNMEVEAGEVIGAASVKSYQMFDFNLIDTRVPELKFVNKERFSKHTMFDLLHEVCPYDYFSPEIESVLYSKISGYFDGSKKRTKEPLCGEYMQDIPNTAQGVWFLKNTSNGEAGKENIIEREILHLALAHEAYDPQKPIISAGSLPGLEPILYFIEPKSSGVVNRDWKDITSDGKIYCSDLVFDDDNLSPAGKSVILKMPTKDTLKIEVINSPCGTGPWSFTDKVSEFER